MWQEQTPKIYTFTLDNSLKLAVFRPSYDRSLWYYSINSKDSKVGYQTPEIAQTESLKATNLQISQQIEGSEEHPVDAASFALDSGGIAAIQLAITVNFKKIVAMTQQFTTSPNPLLYDVIPLLLDFTDAECEVIQKQSMIPLQAVVAQAWNPARLEECQQRLANGETAPPIKAEQYCIGLLTYYLLTDGNHRSNAKRGASIARRLAGKRKISAFVRGLLSRTNLDH